MNDITYLTIQERIELLEKSMAYSPSDAARKVASLAEASMSELIDDDLFLEKDNSKRRYRSVMYKEFCRRLSSGISKDKTDKSPYKSRFGNNYSDYIYIAALSLAALPARLEKYYDSMPQIYYDLRMTLGNYLDALIDISYDSEKNKPDTRRANQYRKLKKELSKIIDLSTPLCKAIDILLNQYSKSHAELDRLSHIKSCESALDCEMQMREMREEFLDYENYSDEEEFEDDDGDSWSDEEEDETPDDNDETAEDEEENITETGFNYDGITPVAFVTDDDFGEAYKEDEDYDDEYLELRDDRMRLEYDPNAYYLSEARKLPDFSAQSPESLYAMGNDNPNLLADCDYSPEGFKARIEAAELLPSFRETAEELITAESIASAFKGMDAATDKLYRLLIEPFAEIEKYSFEQHLASKV